MPISLLTPVHQETNIENDQVDVDVTQPELNTDFEENAPQEGLIQEIYERPGKEYLQESPKLQTQVNIRK